MPHLHKILTISQGRGEDTVDGNVQVPSCMTVALIWGLVVWLALFDFVLLFVTH
jgi:hypothetical protein